MNTILAEPLKYRAEQDIVNSIVKLHTYLNRCFTPKIQVLDNESPIPLKQYFYSNKITFQLMPPHLHRTNKAENSIGTFKDHLISNLTSVDT